MKVNGDFFKFLIASILFVEKMTNCQIDGLGRMVLAFDMEIPKEEGQYQLVAELTDSDGTKVRSLRDFKVLARQE